MLVKLKWIYSPAQGWSQPSYSLMMGTVKVAFVAFDGMGRKDDPNRYKIVMLVPGIKAKQVKWPTPVDAISIGQRVMLKWLKNAGLITSDNEAEFDHSELEKHVKQPEQKDV